MGNMLYLDCATGISADMVVGALLDLGANEAGLRRALSSLNVDGFEIKVSRKTAGALDACDFDVVLDEAHDGHDHDMEYLYGNLDSEDAHGHHHHHHHEGEHHHDHEHGHEGEHHHDASELTHEQMHALGLAHSHDHDHSQHDHEHHHVHAHHHEHRTPADISALIDAADLAPRAKTYAHRIFDIVTSAEAKAHGVALEDVLFHEVGAVDSIVDVVATAYCLDDLDVTAGVVLPLAEGTGQVRTAHGVLSVPVPAVANIVAEQGLVLSQTHRKGEFVTPTGAAIAAAVRTQDSLPEAYRIRATGVGSGKRAYNPPSTVRAMIIEPHDASSPTRTEAPETSHEASELLAASATTFTPHLWKLETEMDDCSGEALGRALELLMDAGAAEAHYLPVFMKKNRPGYQVEVICTEERIPALEQVLFENTTTIGIRRYPLDRTALARKIVEVNTPWGIARAKCVTLPDGKARCYPEYASVAALAEAARIPYQDAYQAVMAAL